MECRKPPILMDASQHYVLTFQTFAAHSDKFIDDAKWVNEIFKEAVVAKLQVKLDEQDGLRVLGIGSGSGEVDCFMLEKLLQRFPRINNRVVEPLPAMLIQYKALVQSRAHDLQGVTFDWRQQTIENYEKAADLTKFHFISAIHSIYHMEGDVGKGLTTMYNRLEPGGVILVVMNSDKDQYSRLLHHLSSVLDHFNVFTSANIRSFLDHRGIPYTQYHHLARLNITKCFDQASEEGSLLLDFLTNVISFREEASEDQQRKVMECLSDSDFSEKTSAGEILLNIDWDAIVISKPVA